VDKTLLLTDVTFCVTVCRQSELKPDDNKKQNTSASRVHIEIEVDEDCAVSLPLQVDKIISAGGDICTVSRGWQDCSHFHEH
jgi:hypothetical protein